MRHRFLSVTAGARHGLPDRVFAPQRRLANIGSVLRRWRRVVISVSLRLPKKPGTTLWRKGWEANTADNKTSALSKRHFLHAGTVLRTTAALHCLTYLKQEPNIDAPR